MENKVVKLTSNTKKVEHYEIPTFDQMLQTATRALDLDTCPKDVTKSNVKLECPANQTEMKCSSVGTIYYYCK